MKRLMMYIAMLLVLCGCFQSADMTNTAVENPNEEVNQQEEQEETIRDNLEVNSSDEIAESKDVDKTDMANEIVKNIEFSDIQMKLSLIEIGVDTDGNGEVSIEEANNYESATLVLNSKSISDIHGIKYFNKVDSIELCNNDIVDISELAEMPELKSIRIFGNQITDITPLFAMKQLVFLDISENQIEDIGGVHRLVRLEELIMWDNLIDDASPLEEMKNLRYLDLNENPVQDWSYVLDKSHMKEPPLPNSFEIDDVIIEYTSSDGNANNLQVRELDQIEFGRISLINDPQISKYAFAYYVPPKLKDEANIRTIVIGNGRPDHESYDELASAVMNNSTLFMQYANEYGYALVYLMIPGQAQYFHKEHLFVEPSASNQLSRPDLEVRQIIEHFQLVANESGVDVHEKVFLTGFSNGGIQSQLFALLHPDMVEATAIGAAGAYTFPLIEFNGKILNYRMGIADIQDIPETRYSKDLFVSIEHFVYVGKNDIYNDPSGAFGADEAYYTNNFGTTTVDRVPIFAETINSIGGSAVYKIYPDIGHDWERDMIRDTILFFMKVERSN